MLDYQHKFFEEIFGDRKGRANISIYRHNYYGRMLKALQILFPATLQLLGEEFFEQAAIAFASEHMPTRSHLHGYHFKFIKYLSSLPQTASIQYLKQLMHYEYLQEMVNNAKKIENKSEINKLQPNEFVRVNRDVIPFKVDYNIAEIYEFCRDNTAAAQLEKGANYYIIHRDKYRIIQSDRVDYATYKLAKLLCKNKNLTLGDVFAKLSLGDEEFAKVFSYFIIKKLLVIEI